MQIKSGLKAIVAGALLGAMLSPFMVVGSYIVVMLYDWAGDLAVQLVFLPAVAAYSFVVTSVMESAPGRALTSMHKRFLTDLTLAAVVICAIWIPTRGMLAGNLLGTFFVLSFSHYLLPIKAFEGR